MKMNKFNILGSNFITILTIILEYSLFVSIMYIIYIYTVCTFTGPFTINTLLFLLTNGDLYESFFSNAKVGLFMGGFAIIAGEILAESPMPLLQKVGLILGAGILGGFIPVLWPLVILHVSSIIFTLFMLSLILFYLDDWMFSKNNLLKSIQILSFVSMFLLCLFFIYDSILSANILNVGNNNKIGTEVNNNLNININDKETGKALVEKGTVTIALGIGAKYATKAVANASIPPAQRVGFMVAGAASVGFLSMLGSDFNKKIHGSDTPSNVTPTPKVNGNINKLIDNSDSNSIQDLFWPLEALDYICLSLIYLLIIQLIFKFYLKDKITLKLSWLVGDSFNSKADYYFNKIITLNQKMSIFWIWFGFAILLYTVLGIIYNIHRISINLDHLMHLHYSTLNNSINLDNVTIAFKSIEDVLVNLKFINYISLAMIVCLIIVLWSKFHAKDNVGLHNYFALGIRINNKLGYYLNKIISYLKDINTVYIMLLIILLIITFAYSGYIFGELYANIDSYVYTYINLSK